MLLHKCTPVEFTFIKSGVRTVSRPKIAVGHPKLTITGKSGERRIDFGLAVRKYSFLSVSSSGNIFYQTDFFFFCFFFV